MRCQSCSCENEEEAQFCEECGIPLVRACPSCGREVRPTAKFCSKCGTSLTSQPPPPVAHPQLSTLSAHSPEATLQTRDPQREPERQQLTVKVCDLVGS